MQRGVVIRHFSSAYEISSHWTIGTTINAGDIFKAIDHTEEMANSIAETAKQHQYYGYREEDFAGKIGKIRQVLVRKADVLQYISNSRPRRALLDFGSTILKYTIGVAKDSDVQILNDRMSVLENSNSAAIDLQAKQLSLVNETMVTARENKERLDQLIMTSLQLSEQIDIIRNETVQNKTKTKAYLHVMLVLDSLIMTTAALEIALTQFQTGVKELSQGNLPEYFVHPNQYLSILRKIQADLPDSLDFLHETNELQLYKCPVQ